MIAHHIIFTAYGFWLPNDPRGSWSTWIGSWELLKFGPATKTSVRHSVAYKPHDNAFRLAAKNALKFTPVQFTGEQCAIISRGFRRVFDSINSTVYGCSILPDHVHLVTGMLPWRSRYFVNQLKGKATESLISYKRHPFQHLEHPPTPWARNGWDVWLDTPEDIHRAVAYVERNPVKEGLPPQWWPFVKDHRVFR
jgi:REP element-mobilizing transposase RayT